MDWNRVIQQIYLPTYWECNNCSKLYKGKFMCKGHPDTDCADCGFHDSVVEIDLAKAEARIAAYESLQK